MHTVVAVIEKAGWDWSTTWAFVASGVAVLALVVNYLTIPKPQLRFDSDMGWRVFVWNVGGADALLVFVRTVKRVDGKRIPSTWENIGALAPSRNEPRYFRIEAGDTVDVRDVKPPFLRWQHVKRFKRREQK
jgi:hypothetical protein